MRGRGKVLVPLRSHQEANDLALANLGLVVTVARDMGLRYAPGEVISRAWPGLYRAAQLYDPGKGCKFSTYGYRWIRQALGAAAGDDTTIHVPAFARVAACRVARGGSSAALKPGLAACAAQAARLPKVAGDGEDGFRLRSIADSGPGPAELAGRAEDARAMRRALATLPVRERVVLVLRYGYDWDLVAIARRLGVTRRWVASVDRESVAQLQILLRPETSQPGGATCSCSAGVVTNRS